MTVYVELASVGGREPGERLKVADQEMLNRLQKEGKIFLSNAVVNGNYCLRSCIVNFRTTEKDIEEIIDIVVETGRVVYKELLQQEIHQLPLKDSQLRSH